MHRPELPDGSEAYATWGALCNRIRDGHNSRGVPGASLPPPPRPARTTRLWAGAAGGTFGLALLIRKSEGVLASASSVRQMRDVLVLGGLTLTAGVGAYYSNRPDSIIPTQSNMAGHDAEAATIKAQTRQQTRNSGRMCTITRTGQQIPVGTIGYRLVSCLQQRCNMEFPAPITTYMLRRIIRRGFASGSRQAPWPTSITCRGRSPSSRSIRQCR
jgi:hypothetical protein